MTVTGKTLKMDSYAARALGNKNFDHNAFSELERGNDRVHKIIGESSTLQRALAQARTVAPTDCTVLVEGETGTGKEAIAEEIHNLSSRRNHSFVKVNCAAIPSGLLESELFGHERGAFTGAVVQRIGRFEAAQRGTLFLDEIGDIPQDLQPKLLRVLQSHEFERLGSVHTIHTDVRIVAASNQNLQEMVTERRFRADLYYRVSVFPIALPPLRCRREDIPLLVRHFVEEFARLLNKRIEIIPSEVMEAMVGYPWPGNVRELQNFVERSVILSRGPALRPPLAELSCTNQETPPEPTTLADAERAHILRTLQKTNGHLSSAADLLGVPRTTLFYMIRRLGISLPPKQKTKAAAAAV